MQHCRASGITTAAALLAAVLDRAAILEITSILELTTVFLFTVSPQLSGAVQFIVVVGLT